MTKGIFVDSNWVANRLGRGARTAMKKNKCKKQGGVWKGGKCNLRNSDREHVKR